MPNLINNYSPTSDFFIQNFQTFHAYDLDSQNFWSITFRTNSDQVNINAAINEKLALIDTLQDNWDEDNSLAPPKKVIQYAKGIIYFLSSIGQPIYSIAPGSSGEIMISLQNSKKSIEILIYPDVTKFVKFHDEERPSQGNFTPDLLHQDLLSWLNSSNND